MAANYDLGNQHLYYTIKYVDKSSLGPWGFQAFAQKQIFQLFAPVFSFNDVRQTSIYSASVQLFNLRITSLMLTSLFIGRTPL